MPREQWGNRHALKHGMHRTPTYLSWAGVVARCTKPTSTGYAIYGGRGIRVTPAWLTFEGFLADMGVRPAGTSLDRRDNDGNYEPGNCRWATRKEQERNKTTNVILEWRGERRCVAEWAERLGFSGPILYARLNRGWPIELVLSTPPKGGRNGII